MSLTILSISQCVYHFSPPDSWSNIDARRTREKIEMCFTILFDRILNMPAQEKQICDGFKMSGSQPPYLYVPLDVVNLIVEFTLKPPNEYDAVITMYHDQGNIPLKLMEFGHIVNVTLGLPIIRTSVDHGTAFDIAGQGVASEASLIAALKFAAHLSRK